MQSSRALLSGLFIGLIVSFAPACGTRPSATRCNADTCNGCCDDVGQCVRGTSDESCGTAGSTCEACLGSQRCSTLEAGGGRCGVPGDGGMGGGVATGGGGGSTGGGSATGGGSSATGGGTATGGGAGDGGLCNSATCPNGCCSASGVCITNTTPSRCGAGGMACTSCTMGNTCVAGACTPCNGCIDINTGACMAGTANDACGTTGFCQRCDGNVGFTCQGGSCQGSMGCNATTCPDGCCDGATCVQRGNFSNVQCGAGTPGAACVGCLGTQVCELDAGTCFGNPNTGGGAGGGFGGGAGGGAGGCLFGFVCFGGCCDSNMQCVDLGNACVDGSTCSPGPFLNLCGAPTGGGGGSSSGGGGGSSSGGGGGAVTGGGGGSASGGGGGGGAATGGGTGTGGGVAGPLYAKVQCRSDADCPSGTCDLAQPGGVCTGCAQTCPTDTTCTAGKCVRACSTQTQCNSTTGTGVSPTSCTNSTCGPRTCGGIYGACPAPYVCNTTTTKCERPACDAGTCSGTMTCGTNGLCMEP